MLPRRLQARVRVHTNDVGNARMCELGTALITCSIPATLHAHQHHRSKNDEEGTAVPSPRAFSEEEDDHGQGETEERQDQIQPVHRRPPLRNESLTVSA